MRARKRDLTKFEGLLDPKKVIRNLNGASLLR